MGKFRNILSAKVSGNVGSMNFRRRGADTVVAERSYENSSQGTGATEAQRKHRSRLANMVNMFRGLQAIEARAWEGKRPYVSDFNMLTSINLATSPVFLTKEEATLKASVIAPYIMSRGSLPSLVQGFEGDSALFGVKVGTDFDIAFAPISQVSRSIIANNPDWRDGDKLSIACLDQKQVTVSGVVIPQVEVRYLEFTLDVNNNNLIDTIPGYTAVEFDKSVDGVLMANLGGDAAFAIHSRKVSGVLQTSEQRVIIKNALNPIYAAYTSEAQMQKAMDSYGYQGDVLLTPFSERADAESFPASIASIMFADAPAVNGRTYTTGGELIIEGENLSDHVVVRNTGTKYVPLSDSNFRLYFNLTSNGSYTIEVDGVVVMAFSIQAAASSQQITSFLIDGTTYTTKQDNKALMPNVNINVVVNGSNLGEITGTNLTITDETGDTSRRSAVIKATGSTYALMVGGQIIAAGPVQTYTDF